LLLELDNIQLGVCCLRGGFVFPGYIRRVMHSLIGYLGDIENLDNAAAIALSAHEFGDRQEVVGVQMSQFVQKALSCRIWQRREDAALRFVLDRLEVCPARCLASCLPADGSGAACCVADDPSLPD
jgi:hypothetical protein